MDGHALPSSAHDDALDRHFRPSGEADGAVDLAADRRQRLTPRIVPKTSFGAVHDLERVAAGIEQWPVAW